MPCHAAMTKKYPTVSPEDPVDDALALMKKEKIEILPVVDEEGVLVGLFSIRILMKNLLPVSVAFSSGHQADIAIGAAPGIAKRLRKTEVLKVGDLMDRKIMVVNPETPTWEGVNALVDYGGLLPVAERDTGKYSGVITFQSALEELQRLKDSDS